MKTKKVIIPIETSLIVENLEGWHHELVESLMLLDKKEQPNVYELLRRELMQCRRDIKITKEVEDDL